MGYNYGGDCSLRMAVGHVCTEVIRQHASYIDADSHEA
jgi:hypothetical protein